jgi:hypothetical protein
MQASHYVIMAARRSTTSMECLMQNQRVTSVRADAAIGSTASGAIPVARYVASSMAVAPWRFVLQPPCMLLGSEGGRAPSNWLGSGLRWEDEKTFSAL